MRLSEEIKAALASSRTTYEQVAGWAERVETMEQALDDRPRSRSSHPATSDWDGAVEGLMKKQRFVYTVFDRVRLPMDAATFERVYGEHLDMPPQSSSGLRTRTSELVDLGALKVVDKLGTSPQGRRAQRIGVA